VVLMGMERERITRGRAGHKKERPRRSEAPGSLVCLLCDRLGDHRAAWAAALTAGFSPTEAATAAHTYSQNWSRITSISDGRAASGVLAATSRRGSCPTAAGFFQGWLSAGLGTILIATGTPALV